MTSPQDRVWSEGAAPAPHMGEGGGALGSFGGGNRGASEAPAAERSSATDDAMRARQELERAHPGVYGSGGSTQFGRASMSREADREVREARFSSTMDIGAA